MSDRRNPRPRKPVAGATLALALFAVACSGSGASEEWASWRGPHDTGESTAVGLIDGWTPEGDNTIWHQPLAARSTPVAFDGRVCANGRAGSDITDMRATVGCWDASDGSLRWRHDFNVYNTTVPFSRVGWSAVAGDAATGYLYHHGVDGLLIAFDRDGNTVWEIRLGEDHGRASGYGGRTQNPVIDGDKVLLSVIGANYGEFGAPRHRFFAFDKLSGEVLWTSAPSNRPWADANTQGTPVVATINGRRLMIAGAADGWVYALAANTGEKIWEFQLSKRGINITPVVVGSTVYVAHSEENVDSSTMGRVVAIDGSGSGDITGDGELWRAEALAVGFSSPLYYDGVLYLVDNSSNLIALDAGAGTELWRTNVGTVGKSSPVFADGKIYYTEVNGRVYILRLGPEGAEIIDEDTIEMPGGERHAEIYGSPAIAYDRIFIGTEAGIYAIGDPTARFDGAGVETGSAAAMPGAGELAWLQIVPAEVMTAAGGTVAFELRGFDADGNPLGLQNGATWLLEDLTGTLDAEGAFRAADDGSQAGKVIAELNGIAAEARVRAFGPLPWSTNFESGAKPAEWMGGGRFQPAEMDGASVLKKSPSPSGLHRHVIFMGPNAMSGITVQADLMGTRVRRRRPDLGLLNGGYTLDLQGNYQRLEVRAWASELRLANLLPDEARVPFEWNEDTWYTMKMRVDVEADATVVRGKVWPRGTDEPEEWTITVRDPLRIPHGAPGIYGYAPVDIFYDNVSVMENQ